MLSTIKKFLIATFLMVFVPISLAVASRVAYADVTQKDFQVIVRTIGFLQNAPSGDTVFAVVYDPMNAESAQDAKKMQELLINGIKAGKAVLYPKLVPVGNLEQLKGADFVFVTERLQQHQKKIADFLQADNALSFTFDRTYTEQGICVVYINASGRVEILINQTAAKKKGIQFKPVFMMMVTTI